MKSLRTPHATAALRHPSLPGRVLTAMLVVAALHLGAAVAFAQAAPAADAGGISLSAGVTGSGFQIDYGKMQLAGVSAFVDLDTRRHIGVEGEATWLLFHQTADVHLATYQAGLRYSRYYGRFQPYVKALGGFGQFNFPYNLATGNYLVATGGAGLDYKLTHRLRWRVVDAEYQVWPEFTFTRMNAIGISTGLRIKFF